MMDAVNKSAPGGGIRIGGIGLSGFRVGWRVHRGGFFFISGHRRWAEVIMLTLIGLYGGKKVEQSEGQKGIERVTTRCP